LATPSYIGVTEGTGKQLACSTYTENGQIVFDQKAIPGEPYLPTYSISTATVTVGTTAASHLLEIMAGASLNVRLRHFQIIAYDYPAAVAKSQFGLYRLTTAGTGGTYITPSPFDPADTAQSTAMTLPSAKGSEATLLLSGRIEWVSNTTLTSGYMWEWTQMPNTKPIIIPMGVANGLAFKNIVAVAATSYLFNIEFQETSF
jgi:hypothetical protein